MAYEDWNKLDDAGDEELEDLSVRHYSLVVAILITPAPSGLKEREM
jgi:hypothetical protein